MPSEKPRDADSTAQPSAPTPASSPVALADTPAQSTTAQQSTPGSPTADHLDSQEKRKKGKASLNEMLKPVAGRIMFARILAAISALLSVAPYVALVKLGDVLIEAYNNGVSPDSDRVMTITNWLIGTFLTQLVVYFIALGITHFADLKLNRILREQITAHIAHAPLAWFSETNSGRIRKAIQDDVRVLHQLVAHAPVETTVAMISPVMLVGYAFVTDWRLGLLSISTLPVYVLLQALTMKDMGTKTAEMDSKLATVSATTVEFADGIEVVKAFGRVGEAHGRFTKAATAFADMYSAWVKPLLKASSLSTSMISVGLLIAINMSVGAALVHGGYVTTAQTLTTTLIALVVPSAIDVMSRTAWSYQLAGNAALRIKEILDSPTMKEPDSSAQVSGTGATTVSFTDVAFRYSPGAPLALDGVNLTLEPHTVTALVGPSGSGKSTLATMLARFHDPTSGSVTIGGVDVRDLTSHDLYRLVSFVLQDPQLPRMSIRDNIRLAKPEATDEEIWDAAEQAVIADDIRALPHGLDTIIGEETALSGGQKQRIAIARAIITDAPILILDEATAATDPDCEADIQKALTHLVADRTVLVIGHKAESIRGADQVIRLENGRVTDRLVGDEATDDAIAALMSAQPHASAALASPSAESDPVDEGSNNTAANNSEAAPNSAEEGK